MSMAHVNSRGNAWYCFKVSTHLKNISQNGSFPQIGMKITNLSNHQPVLKTWHRLETTESLALVSLTSTSEAPPTCGGKWRSEGCQGGFYITHSVLVVWFVFDFVLFVCLFVSVVWLFGWLLVCLFVCSFVSFFLSLVVYSKTKWSIHPMRKKPWRNFKMALMTATPPLNFAKRSFILSWKKRRQETPWLYNSCGLNHPPV